MRLATRYFRLLVVTCLALAAAGCTGTNLLPTGNSSFSVSFEVVGEDGTTKAYDCVNFLLGAMSVRPIDGICAPTAVNAGKPCLNPSDCGGESDSCKGSSATSVIDGEGVAVVSSNSDNTSLAANVLGDVCALSKRCGGFGPICADDIECDTGEFCKLPNGSSAEPFVAPTPLTLSEGLYEVSNLTIGFAMFTDAEPESTLNCGGISGVGLPNVIDEYGETLRFRIQAEGPKDLVFRLDLPLLEDALENGCDSFTDAVVDVLECLTCDGAP